MEQRGEDAPAGIKLVVTNKVGVVALERVKNERLVGLGDLQVGEPPSVGEIQLGDNRLHAETRQLGVHLNVHTLVGLDSNHELVSRNVLEDTRGNILELDADLCLLLVEGLSGLEDERYAVPPFVLDVGNHGSKRWATRVLGNGVVLFVTRLRAIQRLSVLSNDDVLRLNRGHTPKDTHLFVANVLGGKGNGPLHGEEGKHLQQVCGR